jgi:hypothetical protein
MQRQAYESILSSPSSNPYIEFFQILINMDMDGLLLSVSYLSITHRSHIYHPKLMFYLTEQCSVVLPEKLQTGKCYVYR